MYVCLTPNPARHSSSRLCVGVPAVMKVALHLVLHRMMILQSNLILLVLELCWVGNRD
jgi:hypothetical protein